MSVGQQASGRSQTSSFRRSLFAFLTGLSLSTVLLIGGSIAPPLAFAAHGQKLENLGFENGTSYWDATAADSVTVITSTPTTTSSVTTTSSNTTVDTFTKDKNEDISVSPKNGNSMLRMGSPKEISQKQIRGPNKISQTFDSNGNKILISFWLFSWEHRGTDTFKLDLTYKDPVTGETVSGFTVHGFDITMDGSPISCSKTPCEVTIDVGKRGDFLNTGWTVVEIDTSSVPDETDLTLEYTITGDDNESFATWGYFDDVNTPPVAKFDFTPKGDAEFRIIEGDFVTFNDHSYDPDAGDEIVNWAWTIKDKNDVTESFSGKEGVLILPDDGNYTVTLTVTDSFGATNTVSTGGTATDGTFIPLLVVRPGDPLVKALNVEGVAGSELELFGRFLDPGVLDAGRQAYWSISGLVNCTETEPSNDDTDYCVERNIPLIASGEIKNKITTPDSSGDETLTVGGISAPFHIEVLNPEQIQNRREPNENIQDAKLLTLDGNLLSLDGIYLDSIHEPNNIDVFKINNLRKDGELYVKLTAPADYDLVLLKEPSDLENFGFGYNRFGFGYNRFAFGYNRFAFGYNRFGFGYSRFGFGYNRFGFGYSRFGFGYTRFGFGYSRFPFTSESIFANDSLSFDQFPLSDLLAVSRLDGTNLGGADISLSEIGLEEFTDTVALGISANRGIDEEELLIKLDSSDPVYAVVVGHNGAFSPIPYSLQIESSKPQVLSELLPNTCKGTAVVPSTTATSGFTVNTTTSGSSNVLFVYPEQRFKTIYGAGDEVKNKLLEVGDVLVVPSNIYNDQQQPQKHQWDENPCSVDAANYVANQINLEIYNRLDSYDHVVIVGTDQIVPFLRKPDATDLGELDFANESLQKVGTPLDASIRGNYVLTDDCAVDPDPMIFQGRRFCLPKKSIGRLVETPSEIIGAIDAYLANSTIPFGSTTTTGYDFFVDLAQQTNSIFSLITNNNILLTGDWTANELKCSLLGEGTGCSLSDIISLNAHSSQNAMLSSSGHSSLNFLDSVFGNAVSTASNGSAKLVWTSGCHSGLSIPDGSTVGRGDLPFSPDIDLAQGFSRSQNAVYIAQTGYGLGGSDSIAGTEQLGLDFFKQLAKASPDKPVGQVLIEAKQLYFDNLKSMTVYDEKVINQMVLYGLPMFTAGGNFTPTTTTNACGSSAFNLSVTETGVVDASSVPTSLSKVCEDVGSYYAAGDSIDANPGRAIQPKIVLNVNDGGVDAHGVVILGGSFTDMESFDPVIAQNTHEWVENKEEYNTCVNAYTPAEIATINTRTSVSGNYQQKLVVVPGQFFCTGLVNGKVIGVERLYNELQLEVLTSSTNTNDFVKPNIRNVNISTEKNGYVTLTVLADDADSGLNEFIILLIDETTGQITSIRKSISELEINSSGQYIIDIDKEIVGDQKVALYATDFAGNNAFWSGKGVSLRPIYVDAFDTVYSTISPTHLTATIKGFRQLLKNHGGDSEWIRYAWDYGDDSYDTGYLAENGDVVTDTVLYSENGDVIFTISVDYLTGDATFTIAHSYTSAPTRPAVLKITDDFGGVGVDEINLQQCIDAADLDSSLSSLDLTQCSIQHDFSNDFKKVTITIGVAEGVTIADSAQYRINLDLGPTETGGGLPDGNTDITLKYLSNNGNSTGLNSLTVTPLDSSFSETSTESAQYLRFDFDLAELGWSGTRIDWYAETQDGVQAGQQQGFVDVMPDSGSWVYPVY